MSFIRQAATDPPEEARRSVRLREPGMIGRISWRPHHLALWGMVLLPAAVIAQEPVQDGILQQEWREVQTNRNQEVKKNWWQHLSPKCLDEYIQAGADVNVTDRRGWTPLHSAARFNSDLEVLSALLQAGAIVGAKDRAGDTPLHWAAAANTNVKIITSLIEAGADVNATDRFGWTPIHTAAESNANPAVIETLLAAGARPKRRAYFLLFGPKFLLKHNSNMSEADRKAAIALLKESG